LKENSLDKADQIRIVGKGTIEIVYDADGEKLQRAFIPETSGTSTITTYINQFVYQETATLTLSSLPPFSGTGAYLAYMNFEEGRLRAMTPYSSNDGYDALTENGNLILPSASPGYTSGAWDYFIMDYQQNVRMILTEETHVAFNECTMETNRETIEDPIFGQAAPNSEVENTRTNTPSGWTNNTTASVSMLGNIAGHNLGPNTLQKVMAGDKISTTVQYYYQNVTSSTNPNIVANILNNLTALITGGTATANTLAQANAGAITSQLNATPAFLNAVQPGSSSGTGAPLAYLTILFFDERFNLIDAEDGGVVQQQVASSWSTSTAPLALTNVLAPKNGYAYARM
jgi:hypothetical protein